MVEDIHKNKKEGNNGIYCRGFLGRVSCCEEACGRRDLCGLQRSKKVTGRQLKLG